eukprot:TRINITY_DN3095_c2_g1_i1.p1 TRINITY_DN3095_c2_g1~~TRINITY_DN3095_c2_g1_i1.p1  ORF type:complete len:442 (-),score=76.38 TRINITY_DN3095_c2_g1_i1:32-1282(-)
MKIRTKESTVRNIIYERCVPRIFDENVKIIDGKLNHWMCSCAYSPDGRYFVVLCHSSWLLIFDTENFDHINTFGDAILSYVYCVVFSSDGRFMAASQFGGQIAIFKVEDFSIVYQFVNNALVSSLTFSHCSKFIYSGDKNGILKKWKLFAEKPIYEVQIHSYLIFSLNLSNDDEHIVSGSFDKTVKVVNTADMSISNAFTHQTYVRSVNFHPNQKSVISADDGGAVCVWDLENGALLYSLNFEGSVFDFHFLSSAIMLVMSGDGFITSFSTQDFQSIQKFHCDCNTSWFSFAISPDKTQLVCGACEKFRIKVFQIFHPDLSSKISELIELSKSDGYVLSHAISVGWDTSFIRKLVARGIYMNIKEYKMIIDLCWDLVDINESNGGNMHQLFCESNCQKDENEIESVTDNKSKCIFM